MKIITKIKINTLSFLCASAVLMGCPMSRARGQEKVTAARSSVQPAPVQEHRDPDIQRLLNEIQAGNIERTIRKLVSFGTRNTLSAQNDPQRGIGAARDWLYSQFVELRATSGNRLRVEKQVFIQPVAARVPQPTPLTNIVAVLPGDLPQGQERYIIVSGHYDSICTNPTNALDDAPGANDDASGVAVVLETARAMSQYHFHATLVFLTVAGEEQGLLGSTYFAAQAKQNGWRVESMFTDDIVGGTRGGNGVHDNRYRPRVFRRDRTVE